jgi:hypothetical protein
MGKPDPTPFPLRSIAAAERNDHLRADLEVTTPELQQLLATSSNEQQEIVEFRGRYDRLPASTPLAPRSLNNIDQGRSRYLNIQGRLITLAQHYAQLFDLDADDLERLRIEPPLRERAALISFIASLTLYDNHLSLRLVLKDDRLRRLINDPLRGYGQTEEQIKTVLEELNSPSRQRQLKHLVNTYDQFAEQLAARHDPDIDLLQMAVKSNAAYRYARQAMLAEKLPTSTEIFREQVMDVLSGLGQSAIGTLSEVFGNGIGLVEIRKGKLWKDARVEKALYEELQPLDLLLEKTPFRLTDKFIPGHFGHVAVWSGTAGELDELGVFADPLFKDPMYIASESQVRAGRSVLEALRTGVQLSSLAEFLNVDDVVILRPEGLTPEERYASLIRGFNQVGKQYDFNFEVETIDKITCSELPYLVLPDIPWQTEEQLGQHTISPDQVAEQAFGEDAPLRLIDFYHDGRYVDRKDALATMHKLIEAEKS